MIRRSFSEGLKRIGRQNVSLFSIPVNVGQPLLGPDKAPTLIKSQGLMDNLDALNWKVTEFPEITGNGFVHPTGDNAILSAEQDAKNCAEVGYVCEKSYNTILPEAKKDDFILILGGDHCIPIGTIPAIKEARNNLGIVWVDAHADINTPAFSGSGNMHGMPVAFLMDLVKNISAYPSMEWFKPCLTPKDVVYIGLRDLDQPEKETIKKLGIKAYTVSYALKFVV